MRRGRPTKKKEISREAINFSSASDGITKKTFEIDKPANDGSYESGCWGKQLSC